jgi:8-oxo-dGTP pyrophosphatase MutT (NUDIX family)
VPLMPAPFKPEGAVKEFSAGGVVSGPEGLLLIKVENPQGSILWTFPKGHLEAGETPEQAALREVVEETGWNCRVTAPLMDVRYNFKHNGRRVEKTVHWFRMEPVGKVGASDPDEVIDCRWFPAAEARDLLVYKSDLEIMDKLEGRHG